MRMTMWTVGVAVAALISCAAAAQAQTYTQDQQSLCSGDAFRLCGDAIPDVERVKACMILKQAQLSPGCAQFFRPGGEQAPAAKTRKMRKPRHRD